MSLTTLDGLDPPEKRGRGRPSRLTPKLAKEICDRIALGESVCSIVRDEAMPTEMTIYRWVNDDRDGFAKQYADARIRQAWRYQDQIMDIADDGTNDYVERTRKDGSTETIFDVDHYMRSRLRVDTRKWYLAKVLPKVFGDKVQHEHSGSINMDMRNLSEAEIRAQIAAMAARIGAAGATDVVDENEAEEGGDDGE